MSKKYSFDFWEYENYQHLKELYKIFNYYFEKVENKKYYSPEHSFWLFNLFVYKNSSGILFESSHFDKKHWEEYSNYLVKRKN
jgi:hypothetical protein